MRTLVCEGVWFLQQQGSPPFPWSKSLFLIGVLLGVFCGILSIQESLDFVRRGEQVVYLHTQTWRSRISWLTPSVFVVPSDQAPSASGRPASRYSTCGASSPYFTVSHSRVPTAKTIRHLCPKSLPSLLSTFYPHQCQSFYTCNITYTSQKTNSNR